MSSSDSIADGRLLLQLPHNIENTHAFCREGLVPCLVAIRPPRVGALWSHLDINLHGCARSTVLLEEPTLSPAYELHCFVCSWYVARRFCAERTIG